MAAKNKVLWTVRLPSIHNFLLQAQAAKVTAVAIRTTENNFSESMPAFHDAGMRVLWLALPAGSEIRCARPSPACGGADADGTRRVYCGPRGS